LLLFFVPEASRTTAMAPANVLVLERGAILLAVGWFRWWTGGAHYIGKIDRV